MQSIIKFGEALSPAFESTLGTSRLRDKEIRGIQRYPNGMSIEGTWRNEKLNGTATLRFPDKQALVTCDFEDGRLLRGNIQYDTGVTISCEYHSSVIDVFKEATITFRSKYIFQAEYNVDGTITKGKLFNDQRKLVTVWRGHRMVYHMDKEKRSGVIIGDKSFYEGGIEDDEYFGDGVEYWTIGLIYYRYDRIGKNIDGKLVRFFFHLDVQSIRTTYYDKSEVDRVIEQFANGVLVTYQPKSSKEREYKITLKSVDPSIAVFVHRKDFKFPEPTRGIFVGKGIELPVEVKQEMMIFWVLKEGLKMRLAEFLTRLATGSLGESAAQGKLSETEVRAQGKSLHGSVTPDLSKTKPATKKTELAISSFQNTNTAETKFKSQNVSSQFTKTEPGFLGPVEIRQKSDTHQQTKSAFQPVNFDESRTPTHRFTESYSPIKHPQTLDAKTTNFALAKEKSDPFVNFANQTANFDTLPAKHLNSVQKSQCTDCLILNEKIKRHKAENSNLQNMIKLLQSQNDDLKAQLESNRRIMEAQSGGLSPGNTFSPKELALTTNSFSKFPYPNIPFFDGALIEGLKSGLCEELTENEYFWGTYSNGKRNGEGRLRTEEIEYIGEFVDGKFSGQGSKYCLKDNKRLTGEFFMSSFLGDELTLKGCNYKGKIKNEKMHGQGTLIFANGYQFTGLFEDDRIVDDPMNKLYNSGSKKEYKVNFKYSQDLLCELFVSEAGDVFTVDFERGNVVKIK